MCVDLEHVLLVVLPGFQPCGSAQPSGVTAPHLAFMEGYIYLYLCLYLYISPIILPSIHSSQLRGLLSKNMQMADCVISRLLGDDIHRT